MRGYTLVEAVTALTLLGVGVSTLAPTVRRLGDHAAVVAAREEVVATLLEARALALASGGAEVAVATSPPVVGIRKGGTLVREIRLGDGIELRIGAGRDSTTIRFDALGLGRFASETIELARVGATTAVVVSSYGRIRRR
jgi:hypothetical protein